MGTVLVADDDRMCRDSIQKVLEREGYQVEGVADVDSALAALSTAKFDLVVCDYRMPGKSGLDLLEELKRHDSNIPVLMMSAYVDTTVESDALQLGAFHLMRKPIRRKELVDQVAKALGVE
jgi:DNA-binding NtrC family response regulator